MAWPGIFVIPTRDHIYSWYFVALHRETRVWNACFGLQVSSERYVLDIVNGSFSNLCAFAIELALHVFATQCFWVSVRTKQLSTISILLYRFLPCWCLTYAGSHIPLWNLWGRLVASLGVELTRVTLSSAEAPYGKLNDIGSGRARGERCEEGKGGNFSALFSLPGVPRALPFFPLHSLHQPTIKAARKRPQRKKEQGSRC